MFIEFIIPSKEKEITQLIHISKSSNMASELERKGIKFRLGKVVY